MKRTYNLLDLVETPEGPGYVSRVMQIGAEGVAVSYLVNLCDQGPDREFSEYDVRLVRRTRCGCDRRDHLQHLGGQAYATQQLSDDDRPCPCGTVMEILTLAALAALGI